MSTGFNTEMKCKIYSQNICSALVQGPNKDPDTWVFRFQTFELSRSWILSQLSYERVLYIKFLYKPPCLIAKIKLEKSVQL